MKQFFAPISKINKKTREVEGILALEVKDKEGEIMDYESSKAYFEKWSKGIQLVSGGKSVGNLRVMHQNVVGGKFTSLSFDDENKRIPVVAKVSNDKAWQQVLEGELNGFSIYGNVVKRTRDRALKAIRYTVEPLEGSLVDNPCMYGADFTLIREDGQEITAKFAGEKRPYQYWSCRKECDLLHKSEIEASECQGVVAKSSIESLDDLEVSSPDIVSKGVYDLSSLASSIGSLKYIEVPADLKDRFSKAVGSLFSVLGGMVKVEKKNFEDYINQFNDAANAVKTVGLTIVKGEEQMKLKDMEDYEEFLGEVVEKVSDKVVKSIGGQITKSVGKSIGSVVKEALEEATEERFEEITDTVNTVVKTVNKFLKSPAPTKVVSKAVDSRNRRRDPDDDDEDTPKKIPTIKRTSDKEDPDVIQAMKSAMGRPVADVESLHDLYERKNDPDDDDDDDSSQD